MKYLPRILMFIALLALSSVFFFPAWKITLIAPQYPDGVTMYIYINKIGGSTPGTLQNINILNHYVGMKKIVPESIPELKYFPWVVAGFLALGIGALISGKKWAFLLWGSLLILTGILGMYDFYLWEYDYGHNLDPNAPIVFEGQAYQPPLIGNKKILNFDASSWPGFGGYMFVAAILLSLCAFWLKRKTSLQNEITDPLVDADHVQQLLTKAPAH